MIMLKDIFNIHSILIIRYVSAELTNGCILFHCGSTCSVPLLLNKLALYSLLLKLKKNLRETQCSPWLCGIKLIPTACHMQTRTKQQSETNNE